MVNTRYTRAQQIGVGSAQTDHVTIKLGAAISSSSTSRAALTTIALLALGSAGVGVTARHLPITNHGVLFAAVMSPYLMLGGPAALVAMLLVRRWILAIAATCLTAAAVISLAPNYVGVGQGLADRTSVRIMSANLRLGLANADALVSAARSGADLLAGQEVTADAVERLSRAGLDGVFPYRVLYPRDGASGAGLWSRYPITSAAPISGFDMVSVSARVHVSGETCDPTIVVVHVSGPWPQPIEDWRDDVAFLPGAMETFARQAGGGAVVVVGDFNSTIDMRPFRQLLRNGYSDAAEQAGAGAMPTYPQVSWIPPLLGIDHVLVRNGVASAVRTVSLPGSDHRALLATVEFP